MSDPTRYRVANNQAQLTLGGNILAVDPAGPLVMYDDYARLKAEVERLRFAEDLLKDENQHLHKEQPLPDGWNSAVAKACDLLAEKEKEIARLKAEVERLNGELGELEGIRSYLKWNGLQADLKDWLDWRAGRNGSEIPFPKDFLPPNA